MMRRTKGKLGSEGLEVGRVSETEGGEEWSLGVDGQENGRNRWVGWANWCFAR